MRKLSKQGKSIFLDQTYTKQRCKTAQKKIRPDDSPIKNKFYVIGKYKYFVDDLLGEGYSSKVYQAVQIDNPRKKYAIKVIELKRFVGQNRLMLEQQIKIHASLKHQNVVQCFDIIKTPTFYYLILQYCPHGNLSEYIRQNRKLKEKNSIEIMHQICEGYKYLLNQGIVHRDIKPANILRFGNTWKIADFGFAVKKTSYFQSVMNVGTPLYMPLESLIKSQYSPESDIFSLGVTLYQMLHGETPWPCRTQDDLIQSMKKSEIQICRSIKNNKVIQFLKKACKVHFKERISKQQFKKLDFLTFSQTVPQQIKSPRIAFKCISPRSPSIKTINNPIKFQVKNLDKLNSTPQEIAVSQLQFCKFIYSMIQNIDSFLICKTTKNTFWMVLFKFLVRFNNCISKKLQNLNDKKLRNILFQVRQCEGRYQKEYLDYLKHLDVNIIRQVNKKFSQLCQKDPFSVKFWNKLKQYLLKIMKQIDVQLLPKLSDNVTSLKQKIEGFNSVKKLYQFCDKQSDKENANPQSSKKLQIVENFKNTTQTKQNYLVLRKVLINF